MKDTKLIRKNRILPCKVTGREITIKPDKYQKLYEFYGSEDKIKKNFISYTVEKEARDPKFLFWFENCKEMKYFKSRIITILKTFKDSKRTQTDVLVLQNESSDLCRAVGISFSMVEFIQNVDERGAYAEGVKIKNIPFIQIYNINIDEN